jgi:hypothetical protein
MPARRWVHAAALVAALGVQPSSAAALTCPAPSGAPALANIDAEVRLAFLAHAFDREIADVDLWSWTWGSVYVSAGAAQGVAIALVRNRGARVDLSVGAISAGVGALSLYGLPLRVTLPLRDARSEWGDADRCRVLADAEATLASVATTQRLSGGWVPHVGNVVFNAALALILGWGFGRWTSAGLSAGIGTAVGEANVLTQPHRMPRTLDRYLDGRVDEAPPTGLFASMAGRGPGLAIAARF